MISQFSVGRRNPGHWDVIAAGKRVFRVRGGPGCYCVHDERSGKGPNDERREFKTLPGAMSFICDELMHELIVVEGQTPTVIEGWNVSTPGYR